MHCRHCIKVQGENQKLQARETFIEGLIFLSILAGGSWAAWGRKHASWREGRVGSWMSPGIWSVLAFSWTGRSHNESCLQAGAWRGCFSALHVPLVWISLNGRISVVISEAHTGVYAKFWYSLMRAGWLRLWLDSLGHRDNLGQWGSRMPNAFAGAANSWRRKWKTEGERHFYRGIDFSVNFGRWKLSGFGQKTRKLTRRLGRLMDVTGYVISTGFFMDRSKSQRKLQTSWSVKRLFLRNARVRWFERSHFCFDFRGTYRCVCQVLVLMRAGWLRLWLDSLGHRDNLGQWGSRMPNAFAGAAKSWRRKWKTEGERHFYRGFDFSVNFGRRKLSSFGPKTGKLTRRLGRLMDVTGYVISTGFFMDR